MRDEQNKKKQHQQQMMISRDIPLKTIWILIIGNSLVKLWSFVDAVINIEVL